VRNTARATLAFTNMDSRTIWLCLFLLHLPRSLTSSLHFTSLHFTSLTFASTHVTSLTNLLAHFLTHKLHSRTRFTHFAIHSLHSLACSLSLSLSLTHFTHSLAPLTLVSTRFTHSLAHSLTHFTHSLHSLSHLLTSLTHLLPRALACLSAGTRFSTLDQSSCSVMVPCFKPPCPHLRRRAQRLSLRGPAHHRTRSLLEWRTFSDTTAAEAVSSRIAVEATKTPQCPSCTHRELQETQRVWCTPRETFSPRCEWWNFLSTWSSLPASLGTLLCSKGVEFVLSRCFTSRGRTTCSYRRSPEGVSSA
jgi:hypothetical protein